jgi:DNA-binding SARP family transcriptional activator
MRQTALHSHIPLTRHSDQEEQGWAISQGRIALACQSSGLPSMHLQFLGGFQLACGDTPITSINVPRLQSLLAYLVLHAGVPQSRTRLAASLWSDSAEAQTHTNLRNVLCKLRKLLPTADEFVRVDRHTLIWCNAGAWTLDVLDFERAVARAEWAEREGDPIALRVALEQTMARYQGELLPGCYDEWILPERERLFHLFLDVLERLLHLREQEGDYPGAIRVAQRLLREDPLHETTYRHLMRLYAKIDNRSAAVRIYHACAAALERELGMGPASATRQIYEQLVQVEQLRPLTAVKR